MVVVVLCKEFEGLSFGGVSFGGLGFFGQSTLFFQPVVGIW